MSKPIDPQAAVDFIRDNAAKYAKARAERVYLENFLRSKKALLMQATNEQAIGAQERDAYAHPEYIELLQGLRDAVEREETLRWQMVAAQARVEVYRTQEASARMEMRATQ